METADVFASAAMSRCIDSGNMTATVVATTIKLRDSHQGSPSGWIMARSTVGSVSPTITTYAHMAG